MGLNTAVANWVMLRMSGSEYKLLNTFQLIKAVSDTVFDMINAVYDDKP